MLIQQGWSEEEQFGMKMPDLEEQLKRIVRFTQLRKVEIWRKHSRGIEKGFKEPLVRVRLKVRLELTG